MTTSESKLDAIAARRGRATRVILTAAEAACSANISTSEFERLRLTIRGEVADLVTDVAALAVAGQTPTAEAIEAIAARVAEIEQARAAHDAAKRAIQRRSA